MPLFKPGELHDFLKQIGATAKKGLSQNFLIDGNILRKILATAEISSGDLVLEIGSGPGALTEMLLEHDIRLIAVEKDRAFAQSLARFQPASHHLEIFHDDILDFPLEVELSKRMISEKKAKVVSNLPYHLTTPILARLLPLRNCISTLVIMVQDEVARRMTAKPGTSEYSSFTVFLNFYSEVKYAFPVSRHCFYPQPKVDSAVVRIALREPPPIASIDNFFKLTRTAFEHRRKMLRASLKSLYAPELVMQALETIGQNPQARPETLSLDEFLNLYRYLSNHQA